MTDPELGISVSRICFQFTLLAMPDPAQESGRATSLNQCQTLEDLLSKVRKPEQYLAEMQKQFGPDLDPRQFPTSQDAFNSIIKSQKNRIYQESKGLNTHAEQNYLVFIQDVWQGALSATADQINSDVQSITNTVCIYSN
jgi:hypothetical protein